eukprot:1161639-Pelagomonas_calceolata.AAC.9
MENHRKLTASACKACMQVERRRQSVCVCKKVVCLASNTADLAVAVPALGVGSAGAQTGVRKLCAWQKTKYPCWLLLTVCTSNAQYLVCGCCEQSSILFPYTPPKAIRSIMARSVTKHQARWAWSMRLQRPQDLASGMTGLVNASKISIHQSSWDFMRA